MITRAGLLLGVLGLALPAEAQGAHDLSGAWVGGHPHETYDDTIERHFSVAFTQQAYAITGVGRDDMCPRCAGIVRRPATWRGGVHGDKVVLVKSFEHPWRGLAVERYEGFISSDGQRIVGGYINADGRGAFRMRRASESDSR